MNVQILDFKRVDKGSLRAFVDIRVDDLIFRDLRVIKDNGKKAWVASPQTSWKEESGNIRYKSVITFPEEMKEKIDHIVLGRFWELEGKTDGVRSR